MPDEDWTRSPAVALWTGAGSAVAPIALWTVPWLAAAALPDLAWVIFSIGLLVVPLAGVAAIAIGLRARGHDAEGPAGPAVVGVALGAIGIALALSSLAAVWSLSNLSNLQNLQNLQNL